MTRMVAMIFMVGSVSAGCASLYTPSSVRSIGPNLYSLSMNVYDARGGEAGAQDRALIEAKDYCTHLGEQLTTSMYAAGQLGPATEQGSSGTLEMRFRCSGGSQEGMGADTRLPGEHY